MNYLTKLVTMVAVASVAQACPASVLPGPVNVQGIPAKSSEPSKDDVSIREYEEWIHALMYRRERAVKEYNANRYGLPGRNACEGSDLLEEILEIDERVKKLKDKVERLKKEANGKGGKA
ncbi:MAG: hypothetical protein MJZ17_04915 [Bacteroidales bacterium]|nr:hypothetical protein [Bacteroidales bacterium]